MGDGGTSERLESVRRKRERLLASPKAPASFGTWWPTWSEHHAKWGRARLADVAAIEAGFIVTLPEGYRRFVTEIADGGLGPGCGMFGVHEAIADAPEWTGDLSRAFVSSTADARDVLHKEVDGLPNGSLLLAHTGCGCFDILVVSGEQCGTVWGLDRRTLSPFWEQGRQVTFLDWYEQWLDWQLKAM
jgi:hypothetical protein